MKTRRDFLTTLGAAALAGAALSAASADRAVPGARPAPARLRSAADMQRWLLSTGEARLHPRLIEYVTHQIA